ncbi:MAG: mechanosensitive ion channel family protein [Pseudomonadota bacterium]
MRRVFGSGLMRSAVYLVATFFFPFALVCALSIGQVAAQDADTTVEEVTPLDETFVSPVTIDGEVLFVVRGGSALPASERAANIERRIIEIAELREEAPLFVEVVDGPLGLRVEVNGRIVATTTSTDAEYENVDIALLASLHADAIERAIYMYRENRSSSARMDSALSAIGWTVGFLVLTTIFFSGRRRIVRAAEKLVARHFAKFEEATSSVVRSKAVARLVGFGTKLVLWIVFLVALYYYLSFVLLSFAETRPFAQLLLTYVSEPLINVMWGALSYIPNLISLVIIVIVTKYTLRGVQLFLENVEAGTFEWKNFEPHWIAPTYNISRIVIIAIAVVFAYPYIPGSDSRAFQGLTILAGLMVSLGSNTVVSNMMAGIFVIYRRSTNIGDRIRVGDQIGDVVEIKLMETLIKSVKNEMISIPNAQLLNSEVINYSRKIDGRGLLVHTTVGIGYEEPQEKVEAMLIEAALRTVNVKSSPMPFVLWTGLGDFAISYQINAFTNRGSALPKIVSELHRNIVSVFNENGVQIMTPNYESDPEVPKIPGKEWDGTLVAPLGDDEEVRQTKKA